MRTKKIEHLRTAVSRKKYNRKISNDFGHEIWTEKRERRTIVFLRPVSKLFRFLVRGNERRGGRHFLAFHNNSSNQRSHNSSSATRLLLLWLLWSNKISLASAASNSRLFPWRKRSKILDTCMQKQSDSHAKHSDICAHFFPELDHHTHTPFLGFGVTQPFCSHVWLQNHFGGWRQMGK